VSGIHAPNMTPASGIHILGIAGTFMAGVAALAKEAGITVSGSDAQVYPPMSTLLEELGIVIDEGYESTDVLFDKMIVIGNALSRGNSAVEHVLNHKLPYTSGPQWLYENILGEKSVLAVAGTHGKTTTASMLAWILHAAGKGSTPGFLIGGKPGNFERSAQSGKSDLFVVEADEYDTAFFDKRSKFVHYHPHLAILNNLEFDHADIFADLDAIKTQFHHLIRTVPQNGQLIVNADEPNLADVISMGCWTPVEYFSTKTSTADWFARETGARCNAFDVHHKQKIVRVKWQGMGRHNMSNALAAIAAACQTGVELEDACSALSEFRFPDKRLQRHATQRGFTLYEDFAHHPTAIAYTLDTLRKAHPEQRLIALLELRSNTMQAGVHQHTLSPALRQASIACVVNGSEKAWSIPKHKNMKLQQFRDTTEILTYIEPRLNSDDVVVVMSNGDFDGLINRLCHI
jgi:UDP-N-acetylmuramate: L-alanyl-gamma-D-glutamyl-meso-diaminopimelate ligase